MSERIQNVQPREYNGISYRSTLEADTAGVLDALGIPYEYEPRKIELVPAFRCLYQKDKVRAVTYTPDFIIGHIMLECKGFETPEWKIKKKLVFRWLMDNEPDTVFCQIHDARKSLIEALDGHWTKFGYCISTTSKKTGETRLFESVAQAMQLLSLNGKPKGAIVRGLTGKTQWVYGYNWKVQKIVL